MTVELVLSLIGGAGFLAGFAGLLSFFNTRRSTREKSSADAYLTWRNFMMSATDDRDREHTRVVERRDQLWAARSVLIDLIQDLLTFTRSLGATADQLESYHDRLDEVRRI